MLSKKINQYTCKHCGVAITTVQKEEALSGTTPMLLSCKIGSGCKGMMYSMMYQVSQSLHPDHEWYVPKGKINDPYLREHVKMGGLLLRKIEDRANNKA